MIDSLRSFIEKELSSFPPVISLLLYSMEQLNTFFNSGRIFLSFNLLQSYVKQQVNVKA